MAKPYQSLWEAIYTLFKSDPSTNTPYGLTDNQFYAIVADRNATLPYSVLNFIGSREDSTFDSVGEAITFEVTIVSDASKKVGAVLKIVDAFRGLFDYATLTFSGDYGNWRTIELRQGSLNGPEWVDGRIVASMTYTARIEETT